MNTLAIRETFVTITKILWENNIICEDDLKDINKFVKKKPSPKSQWMSRKEAAELLNCSTAHLVRKYEKTERIKNYNKGGNAKYLNSEIIQIINGER